MPGLNDEAQGKESLLSLSVLNTLTLNLMAKQKKKNPKNRALSVNKAILTKLMYGCD